MLCYNPTSSSVSFEVYSSTTPVDGTLVTTTVITTPGPITHVTKNSADSTWDLLRMPGCGYSFYQAQNLCNTMDGGSYLAAIENSSDYTKIMNLFNPFSSQVVRMDIWLNAEYDYTTDTFIWMTTGQNVTEFPAQIQTYYTSTNGSGSPYNYTIPNGIIMDYCNGYIGPRALKLEIRFDYGFSALYCEPVNSTEVCYALCRNYTSTQLSTVDALFQLTTTTPSMELNTNVAYSGQLQAVFSARALCKSIGQTLATLSNSNDFQAVLNLYRPDPNTYAIYQFWIDAQYDYQYDIFRWETTGDEVSLPTGVTIDTYQCIGSMDYRGVILKIEFPQNRFYLYCLPYDVVQCYGLCQNVNTPQTVTSYEYQEVGQWENWYAWSDCYMVKLFMYRNRTYMQNKTVDCGTFCKFFSNNLLLILILFIYYLF
jgi:hypothetical protein